MIQTMCDSIIFNREPLAESITFSESSEVNVKWLLVLMFAQMSKNSGSKMDIELAQ